MRCMSEGMARCASGRCRARLAYAAGNGRKQVATATKKAPQARYAWGAASHCLSLLASDRAASGCRGMMPPGWASEDIDGVRPAQMQELATGAPWVCAGGPPPGG